jgi:hypothetical protein
VTERENLRSIADNGFDLSRRSWGRVWGNGVYVGVDDETRRMYHRWIGPSSGHLTLKLNVSKLAVFEPTGQRFDQLDVLQQVLGVGMSEASDLLRRAGSIEGALALEGYDALWVKAYQRAVGEGPGGNQIVIFDPKKVVVIDEQP